MWKYLILLFFLRSGLPAIAQNVESVRLQFAKIQAETGEDILNSFRGREFTMTKIPKGSTLVRLLGSGNGNISQRAFVTHPDVIADRTKEDIIRILALPYSNTVLRLQKIYVKEDIWVPVGIVAGQTWEAVQAYPYAIPHSENDRQGRAILKGGAMQFVLLENQYDSIDFRDPEPFNPPSGGHTPDAPSGGFRPTLQVVTSTDPIEVARVTEEYHKLPGGVVLEPVGKLPANYSSIVYDPLTVAFILDGKTKFYPDLSSEEVGLICETIFSGELPRFAAVSVNQIVGIPMDCPLAKTLSAADKICASIIYGYDIEDEPAIKDLAPSCWKSALESKLDFYRSSSKNDLFAYLADEENGKTLNFFLKFENIDFKVNQGELRPDNVKIAIHYQIDKTAFALSGSFELRSIKCLAENYADFENSFRQLLHIRKVAQLSAFLRAIKNNGLSVDFPLFQERIITPQSLSDFVDYSRSSNFIHFESEKLKILSARLASVEQDPEKNLFLTGNCLYYAIRTGDLMATKKYAEKARYLLQNWTQLDDQDTSFISKNWILSLQDRLKGVSRLPANLLNEFENVNVTSEYYPSLKHRTELKILDWYKKVVENEPELYAPQVNLNLGLYNNGRTGDSITFLKRTWPLLLSAAAQGDRYASYCIGFEYMFSTFIPKDEAQGRKYLLSATEGDQPETEACMLLADLCLRNYDTTTAVYWYEISAKNNNHDAEYHLGQILEEYGYIAEAFAYYVNASLAGNFSALLKTYELEPILPQASDDEIIEDPDYDAIIDAGNENYNRHNYKGAVEDFNRAIAGYPDRANAYYQRATAKYKLGDYNGAIQDIDQHNTIDPSYYLAYYYRALAKTRLANKRGAIIDYNRAIALHPNSDMCYNNRGSVKREMGDFTGAIKDFDKAISISQNYGLAYGNRAGTKLDMGDFKGAIADFDKSLELDASDAEVDYYNRAMAKFYEHDKEGACRDWKKSADLGNVNALEQIKVNCH